MSHYDCACKQDVITHAYCSAFGHPLGCTGARQVVTALSELKRTGGKIAVTSMCVGTVSQNHISIKT